MKILMLTNRDANQRALAHRIAAHLPIAAIVSVVPGPAAEKKSLAKRLVSLARRAAALPANLPLRRAWFGMLAHYADRYGGFPEAPVTEVPSVNAPAVLDLVERMKPDLVVVSGTNLLRRPLIEKIGGSGRIVNLHTGISPYVKGAPNCTNWCLALRRFDLIGNTVMWLDAGIDSGAIIATERTPLTGEESLAGLHIAVMDHAHELYVRCIRMAAAGEALPSVRQDDLGEGRLFLMRDWTLGPIARAVANFHLHYRKEAAGPPQEPLVLVSPEAGPRSVP